MTRIPRQPRSQRTRASILRAAEGAFAEKGFDAARLEDIAKEVGIRRAAIVYYWKDKRELYEAVLVEIFGGLLERIQVALDPTADLSRSTDAAVTVWVDYLIERPALPRILLREIASASSETRPALIGQIPPFVKLVEQFVQGVEEVQAAKRLPEMEAAHVASAIAGATLFFELAMPVLLPQKQIDLSRDEIVAEHRAQILRMTRRLLRLQEEPDTAEADDRGQRRSSRSMGRADE